LLFVTNPIVASNGAAGKSGLRCGETSAFTVRDNPPDDDLAECRDFVRAMGRGEFEACSSFGLSNFIKDAGVNGPKIGGSKFGKLIDPGLLGAIGCTSGEETSNFPDIGVSGFGDPLGFASTPGLDVLIGFFRLSDSSDMDAVVVGMLPRESRFRGLGNDKYCGVWCVFDVNTGGECDKAGEICAPLEATLAGLT